MSLRTVMIMRQVPGNPVSAAVSGEKVTVLMKNAQRLLCLKGMFHCVPYGQMTRAPGRTIPTIRVMMIRFLRKTAEVAAEKTLIRVTAIQPPRRQAIQTLHRQAMKRTRYPQRPYALCRWRPQPRL